MSRKSNKSRSNSDSKDYTPNYYEFVPQVFRNTYENQSTLSADTVRFMYNRWENLFVDKDELPNDTQVVSWLSGAIQFQDFLDDVKAGDGDDVSFFSAQIIGVEDVELEGSDGVFAHKKRIFLWGTKKNEDPGVQHIDTDITEYENEWSNYSNAWDIALANTTAKLAEANVGSMAIILKKIESKGDIKVRHAVLLNTRRDRKDDEMIDEDEFESYIEEYKEELEDKGSKRGGGSRGRGRSSGGSSRDGGRKKRGSDKESLSDQVDAAIEELDEDELIEDGDKKFLIGALKSADGDKEEVADAIADELEVDDLVENKQKDIVKYAVQLFIDNVE